MESPVFFNAENAQDTKAKSSISKKLIHHSSSSDDDDERENHKKSKTNPDESIKSFASNAGNKEVKSKDIQSFFRTVSKPDAKPNGVSSNKTTDEDEDEDPRITSIMNSIKIPDDTASDKKDTSKSDTNAPSGQNQPPKKAKSRPGKDKSKDKSARKSDSSRKAVVSDLAKAFFDEEAEGDDENGIGSEEEADDEGENGAEMDEDEDANSEEAPPQCNTKLLKIKKQVLSTNLLSLSKAKPPTWLTKSVVGFTTVEDVVKYLKLQIDLVKMSAKMQTSISPGSVSCDSQRTFLEEHIKRMTKCLSEITTVCEFFLANGISIDTDVFNEILKDTV